MNNKTQKGIRVFEHRPDATARLFVFSHAGGDINFYAFLAKVVPEDVEVVGIEYLSLNPGNSGASDDSIFEQGADAFLHGIIGVMHALLDKPFAIFGHSFGALVSFCLARKLQMNGLHLPFRIIMSGQGLPTNESDDSFLPLGWKDDNEILLKALKSWGGTDESIFDDQALANNIAQRLRSHLLMYQKLVSMCISTGYISSLGQSPIRCMLFAGEQDPLAPVDQVLQWREEFSNHDFSTFPGDHFFFLDNGGSDGDASPSFASSLSKLLVDDLMEERRHAERILESCNSGTMEWPEHMLLHEMFEEQVPKSPDAVAVVDGDKTLTYHELHSLAKSLAGLLYSQGVRPNSPVGILMERSWQFVVAYTAALMAGGAYMPLEVVYPSELLGRVMEEAKPPVVLTKAQYSSRLPESQYRILMDEGEAMDKIRANSLKVPEDAEKPTPDSLAYVVMSSGTTGIPKGICCPHRGAVHSYFWRFENFPFVEGDRVAVNVFFVWEVFRPLLKGYPAYIIPDDQIYNPEAVSKYIQDNKITRILFTPSLCQLLLDSLPPAAIKEQMSSLRIVWLCGEVVTTDLRNRFIELLPHCSLLNLYSISECHDVSVSDLNQMDVMKHPKYAACGLVMPNVRVYILDDNMKVVPLGSPGEVYVGGPCVAVGYLNRPDLTAQRFVPDTFGNKQGARLYRTGDRGRLMPDGDLELLGRCDFMVKVRGYSVVLGAVEAAVVEHPQVSSSVVLTEGDEGQDKKLVAYIVPREWGNAPKAKSVRDFLKSKLPHYAIPTVFCLIDSIPVGGMGKLDRKRLPLSYDADLLPADSPILNFGTDLGNSSVGGACDRKRPSSDLEMEVAEVWGSLLNLNPRELYMDDSFFEVGGHSLLLIKMIFALKKALGVNNLSAADVLGNATLEQIVQTIQHKMVPDMSLEHKDMEHIHSNALQPDVENSDTFPDLLADCTLDASIYPAATRRTAYSRFRVSETKRPPHRLFLTGATGWFGSYVLKSALASSDAISVHCLVRAESPEAGLERIMQSCKSFGAEIADEDWARVLPVVGDLSKPSLGLLPHEWKSLAGEVDAILHCGAHVNLVLPYHDLKAANVLGTQEILRLAVTNGTFEINATRAKPVFFVSSNGVFPQGAGKIAENFNWNDECHSGMWKNLSDGYAQTKFVAEKMVLEAQARGLPVCILRAGNLAATQQNNCANPSDFVHLLLSGCADVGVYPSRGTWLLDSTPTDWAANVLVWLATKKPQNALGRTLHLQAPDAQISFLEAMQQQDEHVVQWEAWLAKLEAKAESSNVSATLLSGISSFDKYLQDPVVLDNQDLLEATKDSGIPTPNVGLGYYAAWRNAISQSI